MSEPTFPHRSERTERIFAVCLAAVLVGAALSPGAFGGSEERKAATPSTDLDCSAEPNVPETGASAWRPAPIPSADCYRLTPTSRDASGVSPTSGFVLEAGRRLDSVDVRKALKVRPAVALEVVALSLPIATGSEDVASRFRITPARHLRPGATYRFEYHERGGASGAQRWAFPVQGTFRVVQTLPRNEATEVPLDLGIELTFSHEGALEVEKHFTITPAVKGRFETHKRTTVFVPAGLQPRTLYTVRLSKGVGLEGSDHVLKRDLVFRFETTNDNEDEDDEDSGDAVAFSREIWEMRTAEPAVLGMYSGDKLEAIDFVVYRFAGVEGFLAALDARAAVPRWSQHAGSAFRYDTSRLEKVLTFTQTPKKAAEYGDGFVRFPSVIDPGYYVVEAGGDAIDQTLLEVTDVSTYVSVSRRATLLWANDLAAKGPLAGAFVEVAGTDIRFSTGSDGTVRFRTPRSLLSLAPGDFGEETEAAGNLVVRARDGRTSVVPLSEMFRDFRSYSFREYTYPGDPSPYWRFLHTDRKLYRTSDRLQFWGLVRGREAPLARENVSIELVGRDYSEIGPADRVVLGRAEMTTTERGTFIGAIDFAGAEPGYYEIEARIGARVFASTAIDVRDYVKPAYKIDLTPSHRAVFARDRVRLGIQATFFEGSPVAGARLAYDGLRTGRVVTDALGHASVTGTATDEDGGVYFTVASTEVQQSEITATANIAVYPSALSVDASGRQGRESSSIEGTVYRLDLDPINEGDTWEARAGPASGRRLSFTVTEIHHRRKVSGTNYDFINKRTYKTYSYERIERDAGTYSAVSDANGRFRISFPSRSDRSYEAVSKVTDEAGRTETQSVYVYQPGSFGGFWDDGCTSHLSAPYLAPDDESEGFDSRTYVVGSRVGVTMTRCRKTLPSGGTNRYLFYRAKGGIRDYTVGGSPRFAFTFAEADAPNVSVIGVRFTGTTYEETSGAFTATLDAETRRLRVEVTAEKGRYRPGEMVTLRVRVRDAAGRPADAEVLVGAVDEAIYVLEGQSYLEGLGILEQLYESVPSGVLRTHASHQYPATGSGAEAGGEGDARDSFRDVPLFRRVVTGADGTAEVAFRVPDNLTSWRVTALAVTGELEAGTGTTNVPVGLPMFVDVSMSETYIQGDQPSVRMRAFGTALESADDVAFEVEAPGLFDGKRRASAKAFTSADIPLPALPEGTFRILARATAAGRRDALVRTITVVGSRLLKVHSAFSELRPGGRGTIEGSADRTTRVVFSDRNIGRYYPSLVNLTWSYGDRVDQVLARDLATGLLAQYFDEPAPGGSHLEAGDYQTAEGGIAIYPFADQDLTLSARFAALAPKGFNERSLAAYLWSVEQDGEETRERTMIARYGLAALGENVLLGVQASSVLPDLSVREQLYAGLAATELGDDATAHRIFRTVIAEHGEERGRDARIRIGDRDDELEATSLAAILGAALREPWGARLFDYSTSETPRDILIALEQISYLTVALPRIAREPVRFRYTLNGDRSERTLARGEAVSIRVDPKALRNLQVAVVSGTLGVASSYLVPFDTVGTRPARAIRVKRSIDGSAAESVTVEQGELIKVTLEYDLPASASGGCYQITDLLPSGLRAVSSEYVRAMQGEERGTGGYLTPYDVDGQRVSFCAWRDGSDRTVLYHARAIGTGTFTAEPATMQSQQVPGEITFTSRVAVTIR